MRQGMLGVGSNDWRGMKREPKSSVQSDATASHKCLVKRNATKVGDMLRLLLTELYFCRDGITTSEQKTRGRTTLSVASNVIVFVRAKNLMVVPFYLVTLDQESSEMC